MGNNQGSVSHKLQNIGQIIKENLNENIAKPVNQNINSNLKVILKGQKKKVTVVEKSKENKSIY